MIVSFLEPRSDGFVRSVFLLAALLFCNSATEVSSFQLQLPVSTTVTRGIFSASASSTARNKALFSTVDNDNDGSNNRRQFLTSTSAALLSVSSGLFANVQPAHAGLAQFPCIRPLKNRYHFMRAGPSELEDAGVYSTNPLFLTNRENALADTSKARKIVLEACETIKGTPNFPTVAYHSLAANGMDTADLMATELRISRDRLLPEFTYLDQRGVGLWDSGAVDVVQPAIVALDYLEGGKEGTGGRPPANEDGTPNETLADQFVRLRQFLSLQESRTSGENILIIFPDGTGPALLSAMIAGIPLNQAHCLDYAPGEVRLDISRDSILELYATKKEDPAYLAKLEQGKETLAALRQQKGNIVSLKDQQQELEREAFDNAFAKKQQAQRERERLAQQAKEQARREQTRLTKAAKDQAKQDKKDQSDAAVVAAGGTVSSSSSSEEEGGLGIVAAVGAGVVGLGAAAVLATSGGSDKDKAGAKKSEPQTNPSSSSSSMDPILASETMSLGANGTMSVPMPPDFMEDVVAELKGGTSSSSGSSNDNITVAEQQQPGQNDERKEPPRKNVIDEELDKLDAARQAMDSTLEELKMAGDDDNDNADEEGEPMLNPPLLDTLQDLQQQGDETKDDELSRLKAGQETMNSYFGMDDGADDWLQVIAEIRDTPDEVADRVNGERRVEGNNTPF